MTVTAACFLLSVWAGAVPAPGAGGGSFVVEASVSGVSSAPALVTLDRGSEAGVTVDSPFWMFKGTKVVGAGSVYLVTPTSCAGRFTGPVGDGKGVKAVVVREAALIEARDLLPEGVTLRGKLLRLPPGRRTAWLDLGGSVGLRRDDMLLVSRNGIPIARGQVVELDERTALASLRPVVGNARPEAGDDVELWPAPAERKKGRLNSVVLEVLPDPEGQLVRFVGSSADGVVAGRLVDLFRLDAYVGVAVVRDVFDPISVVQMIESASIRKAVECDVAVVRPAPPDQPIRAVIFKVVEGGDYCLFAAGESDGVQVGEQFVVYRGDPDDPSRRQAAAELVVDAVKYYHCGATVKMLKSAGGPLLTWEFAERENPAWSRWGAVGVVRGVERTGRWATADIDPRCKLEVGQVIRWSPMAAESPGPADKDRLPGGALVLAVSSDEVVLHVPAAWGNLEHLEHARIEVIMAAPSGQ